LSEEFVRVFAMADLEMLDPIGGVPGLAAIVLGALGLLMLLFCRGGSSAPKAKKYKVKNDKAKKTSLRKEPNDTQGENFLKGAPANGEYVEALGAQNGDWVKVRFTNEFGPVEGWIHQGNLEGYP